MIWPWNRLKWHREIQRRAADAWARAREDDDLIQQTVVRAREVQRRNGVSEALTRAWGGKAHD